MGLLVFACTLPPLYMQIDLNSVAFGTSYMYHLYIYIQYIPLWCRLSFTTEHVVVELFTLVANALLVYQNGSF